MVKDGQLKKRIEAKSVGAITESVFEEETITVPEVEGIIDELQQDLESNASFDGDKTFYITISMDDWKKWFGESEDK